MATRYLVRSLVTTKMASVLSRSYTMASSAVIPNSSFLFRLRPLAAAASGAFFRRLIPADSTRGFATRQTSSSLNDPNPNWSNRPPKETILLDGCDFEHWLVVVEKPEGDPTRDEIIDSYIKTLAMVVGREEEARMKIYSVSTRHYFAFGALVSEELSYKLKELPRVRWVLPDSYLDVRNKDYGGEPFVNGQAVPYDPKYHEEWLRNSNLANRRKDRPRNFDKPRNFERRREMQNQNSGGGNYRGQPPAIPPPNSPNSAPMQPVPGNYSGGVPINNPGNFPPNNTGGQPNYRGGPYIAPNYQYAPGPDSGGVPYQPQNSHGNTGRQPYQNQNFHGRDSPMPPNAGPNSFNPNSGFNPAQNSGNFAPNAGYGTGQNQHNSVPMGPGQGNYQNAPPNQNQNIPGRDFPPPSNY